jgi:hypothetical protein
MKEAEEYGDDLINALDYALIDGLKITFKFKNGAEIHRFLIDRKLHRKEIE